MSGNAAAVLTKPAFRKIEWLERDIAVERRPDGVIILKSRIPLKPYEKHIPAALAKWAQEAPERVWLAGSLAPRGWVRSALLAPASTEGSFQAPVFRRVQCRRQPRSLPRRACVAGPRPVARSAVPRA